MTDLDPQTLIQAWVSRWPSTRPIGHELRHIGPDHWIRFHSLPESKRYAENDSERGEVLHRHNTVLGELVSRQPTAADESVLVISCGWSDSADTTVRDDELRDASPDSVHWQSLLRDTHDGEEFWTHLYVGAVEWSEGVLDPLLNLVSEWRTSDVIVAAPSFDWLYHPYDGGADVLHSDAEVLEALRDAHRDWLSDHPRGL